MRAHIRPISSHSTSRVGRSGRGGPVDREGEAAEDERAGVDERDALVGEKVVELRFGRLALLDDPAVDDPPVGAVPAEDARLTAQLLSPAPSDRAVTRLGVQEDRAELV